MGQISNQKTAIIVGKLVLCMSRTLKVAAQNNHIVNQAPVLGGYRQQLFWPELAFKSLYWKRIRSQVDVARWFTIMDTYVIQKLSEQPTMN